MTGKGITPAYLQFPAILLELVIGLGLVLVPAESQVKATGPSRTMDSMPRSFEHLLELYPFYDSHLTIEPSTPTPDDVIRITTGGEWSNVCVPRYQSHQVIGNIIRIEAEAILFGVCIPIEGPTSWSFTVEVGPLSNGLYTVELYILDPLVEPVLYETTSFMVATDRLYLPIILATS